METVKKIKREWQKALDDSLKPYKQYTLTSQEAYIIPPEIKKKEPPKPVEPIERGKLFSGQMDIQRYTYKKKLL